ncbi:hypothetical protein OC835_006864 [Tilletia horrida]|nr:hypothetical protein OC835_006864 [Tilletia horrida]
MTSRRTRSAKRAGSQHTSFASSSTADRVNLPTKKRKASPGACRPGTVGRRAKASAAAARSAAPATAPAPAQAPAASAPAAPAGPLPAASAPAVSAASTPAAPAPAGPAPAAPASADPAVPVPAASAPSASAPAPASVLALARENDTHQRHLPRQMYGHHTPPPQGREEGDAHDADSPQTPGLWRTNLGLVNSPLIRIIAAQNNEESDDEDNEIEREDADEEGAAEEMEPDGHVDFNNQEQGSDTKLTEKASRQLWLSTMDALSHLESQDQYRYIFDDRKRARVVREKYWRIVRDAAIFSQRTGVEIFLAAGKPLPGNRGMKQHVFASAGLCSPENQCLHEAANNMAATWTASLTAYREALIKKNREKDDLIRAQQARFLADQRKIQEREDERDAAVAEAAAAVAEAEALRKENELLRSQANQPPAAGSTNHASS